MIRIFDLGAAGNLKFITMELVEGRELSPTVELVEGRELSPTVDGRRHTVQEAVGIVRQVCRALEAAHAEGVVHRDLKPANIMLNDRGRVWVMDFGLAHSAELSAFTQAGTVLGTPAYVAGAGPRRSD